jgi:thiol-disulfide isomerase/thioredoxin
MNQDYNAKYLKYKEKYLALQKEYNELMLKKNMRGGSGDKMSVILFKADWCGHCKNFKPTWEKVSNMYKQKYNFIVYDADSQTEKFKEYKVDAFPTVLIKTGDNIKPYDGDRSFEDFSNFLQSIN